MCAGTLFCALKVVNLCIFSLLFYLQNDVNQCGDMFIRPVRCLWQNLGHRSDLLCLLHIDENCAVNQEMVVHHRYRLHCAMMTTAGPRSVCVHACVCVHV